jgi:hypothetical protein
LPGAFAVFVLGADWPDASKALFSPVNQTHLTEGHVAFYWTWLGTKTSAASRTIGLLLASAVAWRFRRVSRPASVMAAIAVIVALRPFFEAINFSYYWSPALLLGGFTGLAAHRRVRGQDWIWPLLAILWASPRANLHTASWWWMGELIVLAAVGVQVAANCGVRPTWPEYVLLSFKKARRRPILQNMTTACPGGETSWTR